MGITVEKRNGLWSCRVSMSFNGKRKQFRKSKFKTKRAAERWGKGKQREMDMLTGSMEFDTMTVKDALDDFIATRKKEATRYTYRKRAQSHIIPYIGNIRLVKLSRKDIKLWHHELIENNDFSLSYLKAIHNVLSGALSHAVAEGYIATNIAQSTGNFEGSRDDPVTDKATLSVEEFERFAKQIKKEDMEYKMFFELLFWSGLREGEALALTADDVIGGDHALSLRINKTLSRKKEGGGYNITAPKTSSSNRIVKLPEQTSKDLSQFIREKGVRGNNFLFGYEEKPLSTTQIDRKLKMYLREAGIRKKITVHSFRHSHATMCIYAGMPIAAVSKRLGHSSVEITLRVYSHVYDEKNNSDVDILNSLQKEDK